MSERRDKLKIIYDMLCAIQEKGGNIKPTHLMYKANLSHSKMQNYLKDLLNRGLIEEQDYRGNKRYAITGEGTKMIGGYKKIKEFTDSFGF